MEADISAEVKRDLFVNGLNGELHMHLQLEQPITYNEALRKARVKNSVQKKSNDSKLLTEIKRTVDEMKISQQKKDANTVNAIQQQPMASHLDAMREIERPQ